MRAVIIEYVQNHQSVAVGIQAWQRLSYCDFKFQKCLKIKSFLITRIWQALLFEIVNPK